jgi:signal transduction histidine kinase
MGFTQLFGVQEVRLSLPFSTDSALADDPSKVQGLGAADLILDIVCKMTGMGFAAVARVTEDRWIACAVRDDIGFGLLPGGELPVRTTLCDQVRVSGQAVVIDHVAGDPRFAGHPTPRLYGFQSYLSVPIVRPDGAFFGTLCAIDPKPARVSTPEILGMMRLFADLLALQLDAQDHLAASQADLMDARAASELREQFIAVLGHDLRNPLASIDAGARILRREPLSEKSTQILGLMQKSVGRMAGLIDNVLDFARGRLGGGLTIERREDSRLEEALRHVIAEWSAASAGRVIVTDIALDRPVLADTARIGQLLSNLLGNALAHGAADKPVGVRVSTKDGRFEVAVRNSGDPIAPEDLGRLFQPFTRAAARGGREGLGLGLYIAAEIARAHDGQLSVASTPEQTCFTFTMPLPLESIRTLGVLQTNASI